MSREEAEQEEAKRRSDDVRLQLALSQSENDFKLVKQIRLLRFIEINSNLNGLQEGWRTDCCTKARKSFYGFIRYFIGRYKHIQSSTRCLGNEKTTSKKNNGSETIIFQLHLNYILASN